MDDFFKNADEVLKTEPEVAILTRGISMRPMLREHKDIVIIERVTRKLKKYDVPLYRRPACDRFVLHRIVKITDNGYVIRGDNLLFNEYDVTDDDIIGVLKAFYRNGKYYNCATSKIYKLYIFLNQFCFPFKRIWKLGIKPILSKIKRFILK
jgi:signal peptidase I